MIPEHWQNYCLSDLYAPSLGTVNPQSFPDEVFEYYSVPSHDLGEPEFVTGNEIGSNKQLLQPGDVLISKIIPHIRRAWIVSDSSGHRQIGSTEWIIFRNAAILPEFMREFLISDYFHPYFLSCVAGTAGSLQRARPVDVGRLMFAFPPIDEQREIANCTISANNAISSTEKMIRKLEMMREGILDDLLTLGVREDGSLRDPEVDEFQETEIGRIPVEWEFMTIGQLTKGQHCFVQTGPFGSQLHSFEYTHNGVAVIMPQDMVDGRFSHEKIAYIDEDKAASLARHIVCEDDIVIPRRGDFTKSAYIRNDDERAICGTGSFLVRMNDSILNPEFFSLCYPLPLVQNQIQQRFVGSTMPNLNTSIIESILIPVPQELEVQRIIIIANSLQQRIWDHKKELGKLQMMKTGLQDDLLTGQRTIPEEFLSTAKSGHSAAAASLLLIATLLYWGTML